MSGMVKRRRPSSQFSRPALPRKRHQNEAAAALTVRERVDTPAAMQWIGRLALFALLATGCQNEPLDVAPVELSRMQGKWFEIAKLPRQSQAGCVGTTAEYQLKSDQELLVVNECHEGALDGPLKRIAARAVASDAAEPAKLSLDFGFAYGDYWILEVGEAYEYAVIGHPSRDYLWILSRERSLPKAKLDGVLERAKGRGFPVGILDFTPQR
jgi:apolipoprotein D and lipocalin family protein